jgi:hypothetical protein
MAQLDLEIWATEEEEFDEEIGVPWDDLETISPASICAWGRKKKQAAVPPTRAVGHAHCPKCDACLLFPAQLHKCPVDIHIQEDILDVIRAERVHKPCGGGKHIVTSPGKFEGDGGRRTKTCFDRIKPILSDTSL